MRRPLKLISPGFFREDKGLEFILLALHDLSEKGHYFSYLIAGEPQSQFNGQTSYMAYIQALIASLGLSTMVTIEARYLTVEEQVARIRDAHLGIFAYQDSSHASSGAVPLVMGAGRPVLCTPFEYAKSKEGAGMILAKGYGASEITSALAQFAQFDGYEDAAFDVYGRSRAWTWPIIGQTFTQLYKAFG